MTCTQCTCVALTASAVGWNCVMSNNTCQLITNYSLNDGHVVKFTNGSFLFQQFPPHLLLATSDTTAQTTPMATAAMAAWDCTGSQVGTTSSLLALANVTIHNYTSFSYTYSALAATTRLTLSFRIDSNNWSLDTVSVIKSGTTTELLANGDFHLGNGSGWSSCNPYHATNSGFVINDQPNAQSGSFYWKDGSTGAEDYLYYYFPTDIGSNYTVSFYLKNDGGIPNMAHVYIG